MIAKPPIVIVVEDEADILDSVIDAAREVGFRAEGYKDKGSALEAIKGSISRNELAAVITDLKLDGDLPKGLYSGYAIAKETQAIAPGTPLAIYTSYPHDDPLAWFMQQSQSADGNWDFPAFKIIDKNKSGALRALEAWLREKAEFALPRKKHSFNTDLYTESMLNAGLDKALRFGNGAVLFGERGTGKLDLALRFGQRISEHFQRPAHLDLSLVNTSEYDRFLFGEIRETATQEAVLELGAIYGAVNPDLSTRILGRESIQTFLNEKSLSPNDEDYSAARNYHVKDPRQRPAIVIEGLQLLEKHVLARLLSAFQKNLVTVNGLGERAFPFNATLVGTFHIEQPTAPQAMQRLNELAEANAIFLSYTPPLRHLSKQQIINLLEDICTNNSMVVEDRGKSVLVEALRASQGIEAIGGFQNANLYSLNSVLQFASILRDGRSPDQAISLEDIKTALSLYSATPAVIKNLQEGFANAKAPELSTKEVLEWEKHELALQDILEDFDVSIPRPIVGSAFEVIADSHPDAVAKSIIKFFAQCKTTQDQEDLFGVLLRRIAGDDSRKDYFIDVLGSGPLGAALDDYEPREDALDTSSLKHLLGFSDD